MSKGIAYVALVEQPDVAEPRKYKFTSFEMPPFATLRAWGMDYNELRGDKLRIWSIAHALWNEMSEFRTLRP